MGTPDPSMLSRLILRNAKGKAAFQSFGRRDFSFTPRGRMGHERYDEPRRAFARHMAETIEKGAAEGPSPFGLGPDALQPWQPQRHTLLEYLFRLRSLLGRVVELSVQFEETVFHEIGQRLDCRLGIWPHGFNQYLGALRGTQR